MRKYKASLEEFKKVGESLKRCSRILQKCSIKLVDGKGSMVRQAEMLQDLGVKTDKTIPREFKKSLKDQT
ncbi:MAG: hypothetical protein CM1200mP28_09050 [Deltaproteobacteria bacterium]|nr:MAG: hypothetical protein CM1200mP28_09050 [Deltaproteobacteria bacterium]